MAITAGAICKEEFTAVQDFCETISAQTCTSCSRALCSARDLGNFFMPLVDEKRKKREGKEGRGGGEREGRKRGGKERVQWSSKVTVAAQSRSAMAA